MMTLPSSENNNNNNCNNDDDDDGCKHYKNKCEILAPCCFKYYRCFRCHDDDHERRKCDDNTQSSMDRSKVTKIRCIECKLEQQPSKQCKGCSIKFADYVCLDCSLYRHKTCSDQKQGGIFHCPDCGICRIGKGLGISHWHCHSCVACLSIDIDRSDHTKVCRPLAAQDDCCICFESMKDCQQPLMMGKYCGHFLHQQCCDAYFQTGKIDCPICKRPLIEDTITSPRRIKLAINYFINCVIYMILPAMISSYFTMHAISVVDMHCADTGELLLGFWVVLVWILLKVQLHQFGIRQQQLEHIIEPLPLWLRWYSIVTAGILLSCSMCYFSICIF